MKSWTNKETARNLLDVRIILAVLWVAGMLSSLNGDTYRLSDPVALKSLIANTGPIVAIPRIIFGNVNNIRGFDFYECLDPDVEVSRESLGKPHHRHTLCCDYSCILGFSGFVLQSAGYEIRLVNSTTCVCLTGCLVRLEMD